MAPFRTDNNYPVYQDLTPLTIHQDHHPPLQHNNYLTDYELYLLEEAQTAKSENRDAILVCIKMICVFQKLKYSESGT